VSNLIKCEVLSDTVLAVKKGSIILVDPKQFELARRVLKPVESAVKKEKKKKETE